jgi:hypothetical protein
MLTAPSTYSNNPIALSGAVLHSFVLWPGVSRTGHWGPGSPTLTATSKFLGNEKKQELGFYGGARP